MKYKTKSSLLIVFFSFVLLGGFFGGTAFPQPSTTEFTLVSEYKPAENKQTFPLRRWLVRVAHSPDGVQTVEFYLHRSRTKAPICALTVNPPERGGIIQWQGLQGKRTKTSANGILIIPGHPAPCDLLPPEHDDQKPTFEERESAGERVFVKQYRISYRSVAKDEAVNEKWLKNAAGDHSSFQLRTVVDEQGALVVRQLWPEGAPWWVYEETPLRRSWLVEE